MKEGYINVVFVIDESGSMGGSESDIIGGFNKTIQEQKDVKDGKCTVSLFTFNDNVIERFVGKDVHEVQPLERGKSLLDGVLTKCHSYSSVISVSSTVINGIADIDIKASEKESNPLYQYCPNGLTAMNDGIGTAIDKIGKWLSDMSEEERPSKNLIIIMTDGEENASKEYTLAKVQEMIKHQTEKYDWSFVYMGMDITSKDTAESLGIKSRSYTSKSSDSITKSWDNISYLNTCYRNAVTAADADFAYASFNAMLSEDTKLYESQKGIKIEDN